MATLAMTAIEARAIGVAIAVPIVFVALVGLIYWVTRSSRIGMTDESQTPPKKESDNPFGE
jgi:hypothetical protein